MVQNIQVGDIFYIKDAPLLEGLKGIVTDAGKSNVRLDFDGSFVTVHPSRLRGVPIKEARKLLRFSMKGFSFQSLEINNNFNPKTNTLCIYTHNDSIIGHNQVIIKVKYLHDIQNAVRLITGKEILL